MRIHARLRIVALSLLLVVGHAQARTAQLPEAQPAAVGFSEEGIAKLDEGLHAIVDEKKLAGVTTLLARHGKVVHRDAYGSRDIAAEKPMELDTIVRIYSMTKPITGVAMMMLYEQGKWKPSDPIAKHLPEFKDVKVYGGQGPDGQPLLVAPEHAPTMGELMTHTAGFTYGLFGRSPVDLMYQKENLFALPSLKEFASKVSRLPLLYQPGTQWVYSVSVDLQGYAVERLSGKSLPDFMRERIFEPLGMKDTGFSVPAEKLDRVSKIYTWNGQQQELVAQENDPKISETPGLPQGGGGLYSTAADYLQFAQMLLNGGELNGKRLLKKETVKLMRTNHLPEAVQNGKFGLGQYRMKPGSGFGYDVAVVDDPERAGNAAGKGTFAWFGIAGTWFWVDPTNDVIFIGMIQRRGGPQGGPNLDELTRKAVYSALVDPKK